MSYVGVPPFGQTVRTVTERIAQQDQTIFYPDGGYLPGYIDVELDGSDLGSQDFTATDGLSVVLTQKAGAGDLFRTKAYWPVAMVDTMRRAEINGIVGAGGWAMRNRLINGDMRIDQRNAGASVANIAGSAWSVDRWRMYATQATKFTLQQNAGSVTPPAGYKNYLGLTVSNAYSVGSSDEFLLIQSIEGLNIADLAWGTASASPVTLSFWVRSSITGAFGGTLQNDAQTQTYPFTFTINSANTWEQKSLNVTGSTSGTWDLGTAKGIRVCFSMGSGSGVVAAAGAWNSGGASGVTGQTQVVATAGATFYITGVQLEKGSYATPFDFRPIGTELALCQRYCQRYSNGRLATGGWTSVTTGDCYLPFVQQFRTTPTFISSANGQMLRLGISWSNITAISLGAESSPNFAVLLTSIASTAGATVGDFTMLGNGGGGSIDYLFTAEL